ncbi:MAG TPA: hypothetical protein PLX85_02035, partial [Dehalococcoidia bacterium]|nr:hypothetical protein [Dehalococcoidia bacterium]
MALPRRRVLMVPVTGIAVAVAVAILLVNRDERPRDEGTPAPASTSLLFAEFGTNADRVFRAEARDPSVRSLVATIPHAPEWGINAAARPAGDLVAFTVLPATARPERDTPAELRVLDLADGRGCHVVGLAIHRGFDVAGVGDLGNWLRRQRPGLFD